MYDEIPISPTESFRPRYDTPNKDLDRLIERVADLSQRHAIERVPGQALFDTHVAPAFDRVIDGYIDKGLYAEIEAHYTQSEAYSAWPFEGDLQKWRVLVDRGQGARVVRLWRNHIACLKADFWYLVNERNAGFRKPKYSAMSDASDRARYANLIAGIPRKKEDILSVMALARTWFEQMGAPAADLARLAEERGEIEAEARRAPAGKPDPRAMDDDVFWEIIGTPEGDGVAGHIEAILRRLERFKATPIKAFDKRLQTLMAAAYRADVWALAYLLNDGCSDDAFEAFRCWLVLQGCAVFEGVTTDPDAFEVARFAPGFEGALSLLDTPALAYEARSGKPLTRKLIKMPTIADEDLREDAFPGLLPRIAAQVAPTSEKPQT